MAIRKALKRTAETLTPAIKRVDAVVPEYMGVDEAEILSGISRWTWRQYAYRAELKAARLAHGC